MEDVIEAIANCGECDRGDIRAGGIRRNWQSEGDIWIRCSWSSASELSRRKKIKIGWMGARVELMEPSPLQCYRCWEYGHVKAQCRNRKDRASCCYKCGQERHRVAKCGETPRCALCKDRGVKYDHRMGSRECEVKNLFKSGRRQVNN